MGDVVALRTEALPRKLSTTVLSDKVIAGLAVGERAFDSKQRLDLMSVAVSTTSLIEPWLTCRSGPGRSARALWRSLSGTGPISA